MAEPVIGTQGENRGVDVEETAMLAQAEEGQHGDKCGSRGAAWLC